MLASIVESLGLAKTWDTLKKEVNIIGYRFKPYSKGGSMKEFKDRIAVVAGAASGIGRGLAEIFAGADMKVVLADIDESNLQATVNTLEDSGADVIGLPTDMSKPDQVKELAAKAIDTFGAVHVLCNNAGVGYGVRKGFYRYSARDNEPVVRISLPQWSVILAAASSGYENLKRFCRLNT